VTPAGAVAPDGRCESCITRATCSRRPAVARVSVDSSAPVELGGGGRQIELRNSATPASSPRLAEYGGGGRVPGLARALGVFAH
jgi:hypothetical protein